MLVDVANLGKDDVLVFSIDATLNDEAFKKFRSNIRVNLDKAGLPNQKFIALDGSTTLKVLKTQDDVVNDEFAQWARSAIRRRPRVSDWAGISFKDGEKRAQALCNEAARTGMTINLPEHLYEWHKVMRPLREAYLSA